MKHVVIIGAGFGGIYSAKKLIGKVKLTLIDPNDFFMFTPLLHEVISGKLDKKNITIPIKDILKDKNFNFIKDKVKKVNTKTKTVFLDDQEIKYDYVVLAYGSKTNYYGVPGQDYTIQIKELSHGNLLNSKLKNMINDIVIIGGGATGCEVAGEVSDMFLNQEKKPNLTLINAGKTILPMLSKKLQDKAQLILQKKGYEIKNECVVKELKKDKIITNQENYKTDVTIWAGGVQPNLIETIPELNGKRDYIVVDETLQVKEHNNVFAIGDIAYIEQKPVPGLAQVAMQESNIVAKNIMNSIDKKPLKKFKYHDKGTMISLGKNKLVGEINLFGRKIKISGFIFWNIKRLIYFWYIFVLRYF